MYMAEFKLSPEAIEAEYQCSGHSIGWRFLTSAEKNIDTAEVALVSNNPAGHEDDLNAPRWSVENGNAYATEKWKNSAKGEAILQRQVKSLIEVVGVDIEGILSGYFVPFRSPSWPTLHNRGRSIDFGRKIWTTVLARSPAKLILVFGQNIERDIGKILCKGSFKAVSSTLKEIPAMWGNYRVKSYICTDKRVLISLPHLSHFQLFNRTNLAFEQKFEGLIKERRRDIV
jgi:hypothetical protein